MSSPAAGHAARTYPPRPEAVYFYGTCLVDMFVPEAGMDAIALLEREGIRVIFPDNQTCCGQPPSPAASPTKRARWSNPSSTCSPATTPSWCRPAPAAA
jgi:L-lactate dehydrogenase complex protein LldE